MQVFLQPVGGSRGPQNFAKTVERSWRIEELLKADALSPEEKRKLQAMIGAKGFGMWGIRPRSTTEAHWRKMADGDLVLFYNERYIGQAKILGTLASEPLARMLWGDDDAGETASNIYFFSDFQEVSVPRQYVNKVFGFNDLGYGPNGMMKVVDEKASGLLAVDGYLAGIRAEMFPGLRLDAPRAVRRTNDFPKEAVADAIAVSLKVSDSYPAGRIGIRGETNAANLERYHDAIEPMLNEFKRKYGGNPPASLITGLLDSVMREHALSKAEYTIYPRAHYGGSELNRYVWGCIYKRNENGLPYSNSPQLYILINGSGIKIGFDYGHEVEDDDPAVLAVKNNRELCSSLAEVLSRNPELKLYRSVLPEDAPRGEEMVEPATPESIASAWTSDAHVIAHFGSDAIPEQVGAAASSLLGALVPLFTTASGTISAIAPAEEEPSPESTDLPRQTALPAGPAAYGDFENDLAVDFERAVDLGPDLVFEDRERIIKQIVIALASGKHVILTGPPGTGKSKLAAAVCEHLAGRSGRRGWKLCTASSDWSPYETIGGYRQGPNSELEFFPGEFLACFQDGNGKPTNIWLIIDEINRADIDKAFGALFSALTGQNVSLPYMKGDGRVELFADFKSEKNPEIAGNRYIIPPDWRMIATMNTVDKASLYEMSYAFMRRFAFVMVDAPQNPDPRLLERYEEAWKIAFANPQKARESICAVWNTINRFRRIGPAIIEDICRYVMESGENGPGAYQDSFLMYVLPQLEGLDDRQHSELLNALMGLECMKGGGSLFERTYREFFGLGKKEAKGQ